MRRSVLGPRAGLPPDAVLPLGIVAVLWGAAGLLWLAWLLGGCARWLSGGGWVLPPFSLDTLGAAVDAGPPRTFDAPPWLLFGLWAVAGALLLLGAAALLSRPRPTADDPVPSLAGPRDLGLMTPAGAEDRARGLRPGLARRPQPADTGLAVGLLEPKGPLLRASWEDVVVAIMAPRAGKTTSLAVPIVLAAPGPVIATSNKADLVAATAELRAARPGARCWVFDPQGIARTPREFTFNPLAAVQVVGDADRLAKHFVQEVSDGKGDGDFWVKAATDLLTALILAAALDGRDLAQVYRWLNDSSSRTPVQLLRRHGHLPTASALEGRQNGAVETKEGIFETARTAAQALRDPEIMAWVTPDPALPEFDPAAFVATGDAVYAMSKDGGGSAAPLVAAMVDALMRQGVRAAEAAGGRLDPPMVAVLDEAANVAKIKDLPDLYSHLGSRGVVPVTILQSYRQGVRVWSEDGMGTLWSAATVKLVGAGIDDPRFAEDVSKLIGDHDVTVRSATYGRESSHQHSLRRQRILPPEAVRALPRGRAILLATGMRAAMVRLQPWYSGPDSRRIAESIEAATTGIAERARSEAPPARTAAGPPGGTGGGEDGSGAAGAGAGGDTSGGGRESSRGRRR